jgi:putative transposase
VADHSDVFDVSLMCTTLAVSRSGYYAWRGRQESSRSVANRQLLDQIRHEHERSRQIYGSPRIHAVLKSKGASCSRNRVARLMRQAGIRSKVSRRYRRTTNSKHHHKVAENVLSRDFCRANPNEVWVSDITYIATDEGWLYLASTMDLFSRRVIGWSMGPTLEASLTVDALQMAIDQRSPPVGLLHHSDRGVQYAADAFQLLLEQHGVVPSMSGKGNCYDNAVQESFFHTLKTELCHHEHYRSRAEARASVFEYIEVFYNRCRVHSTIGNLSPAAFERQQALSTGCQSPPPGPPPRGGSAPEAPRCAPASRGLAPRGSPGKDKTSAVMQTGG